MTVQLRIFSTGLDIILFFTITLEDVDEEPMANGTCLIKGEPYLKYRNVVLLIKLFRRCKIQWLLTYSQIFPHSLDVDLLISGCDE